MSIRTTLSGLTCLAVLCAAPIVWAASMNQADQQFLAMAAKSDMTEAHEGQMAENQAVRTDVRAMAKALVQDHTQSYEELTELATKAGVSIPKGINAGKDPAIRQLVRLKGANFDRQFAREEIAAHRHAIAVFEREAAHGQDPAVKAYASKMVPVLEKHLRLAEDCTKPAPHA